MLSKRAPESEEPALSVTLKRSVVVPPAPEPKVMDFSIVSQPV